MARPTNRIYRNLIIRDFRLSNYAPADYYYFGFINNNHKFIELGRADKLKEVKAKIDEYLQNLHYGEIIVTPESTAEDLLKIVRRFRENPDEKLEMEKVRMVYEAMIRLGMKNHMEIDPSGNCWWPADLMIDVALR